MVIGLERRVGPLHKRARTHTFIWALAANLNKRNDTLEGERQRVGWRMRSRRCCYGNSGELGLGAARQQVWKERRGGRRPTHSNVSSRSPCWSHVIPNYRRGSEEEGARGEYRGDRSIQVSRHTFQKDMAVCVWGVCVLSLTPTPVITCLTRRRLCQISLYLQLEGKSV